MPKYPELSHVMLAICTIFHGNADSERVFSAVRHIDTDFRQCMSEELFDALMVVKRHLLVSNKECHNYHFTPEFLARAKSATTKANLNLQKEGDSADIKGDDVSGKILRMLGGVITAVILNSRCIDIEVPRDIVSSNFLNDL